MAFTFQCPRCGVRRRASRRVEGRRVRCPACGQMVVGKAAAAADAKPNPPRPAPENEPPVRTEMTDGQRELEPMPAAPDPPIHFKDRLGGRETEMDMTPMVDVTFLLLIFFMITAAFTLQKSIETPKPQTEEPSTRARSLPELEEDPRYVVVRIDAYNTYRVQTVDWDREAPHEQDLLIALREARRGRPGSRAPTRMLVVAHGDSLHEYVVTALDAGAAVGMQDVQLTSAEDQSF